MDFLRKLLLCLLFCCPMGYAALSGHTGLVFVHGTNDHRQDAEGEYWKRSFLDKMIQALPVADNYLVVACDYSQYMWHEAAAGCTVNQILQFIQDKKLDKVIIYTHSNGGNVVRWILSNPTFDARYFSLNKYVEQVIALAPSSGGTPLADEVMSGNIFEESLGWLLGYRNDSVRQQRPADMALFNDEILLGTPGRANLPVPFRVVVGTDVTASPFSSASYCNGYRLSTALKFTKFYLENCADGFLNCSSQILAGTVWFYDYQKTDNQTPLSHSQSRHDCFGLEAILTADLMK